MSNVIRYASVYIQNETESISFYTQYLKFTFCENVKLGVDEEWWILRKDERAETGIILIKLSTKALSKSTLILHTHDCILAYCRLREAGATELSTPLYSSLGLSFSFYDPNGNKIMLLEERKYNDLEI
ncbi:VOC family protein [Pedobacter insulae]|uniref:Glyoxalase/fosfomycin resistance/dioxygenase domain-containing protein n=1 Tax=Pedobacter insulae TaxID=414048 RepID=A0A1I2UTI6_9SPHI|nr:VOC family protein [Pedobacter insulae]SFG80358.1 hypothetical protein SAMN04489864_102338 [Pedobacter insulae]